MSGVLRWTCVSGDGTTGVAQAWRQRGDEEPSLVQISIGTPRSAASTVLEPRAIREIAAGLLTLADEVDGETPLVFMPDCPTCTSDYPPGHPSRSAS